MARGRFVSRSISTCEQLGRVSVLANLFFDRCIPHIDVEGRLSGNSVLLKGNVVPLVAAIPEDSIPALVAELAAAVGHEGDPLVLPYEVNGSQFLYFPGFGRQQQGLRKTREAASRIPPPPIETPILRTYSGVGPDQLPHKRREVQGKKSDSNASASAEANTSSTDESDVTRSRLARVRDRFLQAFYAEAPLARQEHVLRSIDQTLVRPGCRVERGIYATATPETLVNALEATLERPPRRSDAAVVVVLKKLLSGACNVVTNPAGLTAGEAESAARRAEPRTTPDEVRALIQAATPRPEASDLPTALEWIQARPDELHALELEVDADMDRMNATWRERPWAVGLRARNLEEAVLRRYRTANVPTRALARTR